MYNIIWRNLNTWASKANCWRTLALIRSGPRSLINSRRWCPFVYTRSRRPDHSCPETLREGAGGRDYKTRYHKCVMNTYRMLDCMINRVQQGSASLKNALSGFLEGSPLESSCGHAGWHLSFPCPFVRTGVGHRDSQLLEVLYALMSHFSFRADRWERFTWLEMTHQNCARLYICVCIYSFSVIWTATKPYNQ